MPGRTPSNCASPAGTGTGEWGGSASEAVQTIGEGDVVHDLEQGNDAHCTLTVRGARARALALACEVTVEPTSTSWIAAFAEELAE